MSRQEANEQYAKALKAGQKHYRECVLRGRYPYPQVLDEILDDSMAAGRVDMGLLSIPTEGIVGAKAAGRASAFAANFMPLLAANTEFAAKWVELCMAHLGEGIRDPIRCYEYMGRFYVQEGNKRVSVLKSYGAPAIDAYVTRIIPAYSQDQAIQVYYEFLNSFPMTGCTRTASASRGASPSSRPLWGLSRIMFGPRKSGSGFSPATPTFRRPSGSWGARACPSPLPTPCWCGSGCIHWRI